MRETQHPRTQLAWSRTGLSVLTVGLVEVRLLIGPNPDAALWVLGAVLAAVLLLGIVAGVRLRRNVDALEVERVTTGGRAPLIVAAAAALVGALGVAATTVDHVLVGQ